MRKTNSIALFLRVLLLTCALSLCLGVWATALEFDSEVAVPTVAPSVIDQEIEQAAALNPKENLPVRSAILLEQSTGKVLFALNEHEKLPPASVTKIMSLLLVMQALESGQIKLADMVTVSKEASQMGGSQIWLKEGEQMSVGDLLKAAAIASANDATYALGEHVAGSEMAFVEMMNQEAKRLGMNDTTFMCSAGLDEEGHLTSAYDIAIMSRELMKYPAIKTYTTVWMDSLRGGQTELVNTNRLVRFYKGATGLKTGTTSGAGSCLSATAERDGMGLIAVVMGSPTSDQRFAAARSLLDMGFAGYQVYLPAPPTAELLPVKVRMGVEATIAPTTDAPPSFVIEKSKKGEITQKVNLVEEVEAPVEQGQKLGSIEVLCGEEVLGEYPIVASQAVERLTFGRALLRMLEAATKTK